MPQVIEVCLSNIDTNDRALLYANGANMIVQPCLEQCGICYTESFLVVDGELETGANHSMLLKEQSDE